MSEQGKNENTPLEVTAEMVAHLPKLYREVGWEYVREGKIILKKPEEEKT